MTDTVAPCATFTSSAWISSFQLVSISAMFRQQQVLVRQCGLSRRQRRITIPPWNTARERPAATRGPANGRCRGDVLDAGRVSTWASTVAQQHAVGLRHRALALSTFSSCRDSLAPRLGPESLVLPRARPRSVRATAASVAAARHTDVRSRAAGGAHAAARRWVRVVAEAEVVLDDRTSRAAAQSSMKWRRCQAWSASARRAGEHDVRRAARRVLGKAAQKPSAASAALSRANTSARVAALHEEVGCARIGQPAPQAGCAGRPSRATQTGRSRGVEPPLRRTPCAAPDRGQRRLRGVRQRDRRLRRQARSCGAQMRATKVYFQAFAAPAGQTIAQRGNQRGAARVVAVETGRERIEQASHVKPPFRGRYDPSPAL